MAHYRGAASEGTRAAHLLKQREQAKEELEKLKQRISEDHQLKSKFESFNNKFSSSYDAVEEELKSTTVGLFTLEEMRVRRDILIKEREKQMAAQLIQAEEQKKSKSKHNTGGGSLSFNMNEDEEEEGEEEASSPPPVLKKRKLGKNPTVDTSFLPDRDREEEERQERERLGQQWVKQQEKTKGEEIKITYSYWDGSGHRRSVTMQKGNTIYQFLQKCLENLRKEFSELRACAVDNLMYIKEDLIIPQHYSFYDFIINKARGKSGPLFSFDVHEDVRLITDANVEKDESHAGKVVLRNWYERNKHIFPASRWEPYDPEKHWDKYTISDNKEQKENK